MKINYRIYSFALLFLISGLLLSSFGHKNSVSSKSVKFPYKKAGLTERQAAAHLLSRFSYGAKPGQVDDVVKQGLEQWFLQQLQADFPDQELQQRLATFKSLQMSNQQIVQTYPLPGPLERMAIQDGAISRKAAGNKAEDEKSKQEYRAKLAAYMKKKGFQPLQVLYRELINQKILRATYSENQLQEILTTFWFNHFNVSITNRNCSPYITSYERDIIRPNALGKFETLLLRTAKSPAMLTYLDNSKSSSAEMTLTPVQQLRQNRQMGRRQTQDSSMQQMQVAPKVQGNVQKRGLNENYAREIMELHTLGVDGGYTQKDVTQAARVLTGWTVNPNLNRYSFAKPKVLINTPNRAEALTRQGFVVEGDFLFAANRHDKGKKEVLGTTFSENGGYEEGLQLIKLLAYHPSTAKFISTKLAVRFVNDAPPKSLVDKMAKTFTQTDGDIQQVLLTMVSAPEFWSKEALREKTKSPFELAISSVRSLNAEVKAPYQLYNWITKMGERMYYYQAPTGFPDKGTYWLNTGSLLNRMNFGLALAAQKIPGISIDLMALNQHREPESAAAALVTYSQYLLPERDLKETIKRLTPTLNDPSFSQKVNAAANKNEAAPQADTSELEETETMMAAPKQKKRPKTGTGRRSLGYRQTMDTEIQMISNSNPMLAQVVGIILGSPEFQRR